MDQWRVLHGVLVVVVVVVACDYTRLDSFFAFVGSTQLMTLTPITRGQSEESLVFSGLLCVCSSLLTLMVHVR